MKDVTEEMGGQQKALIHRRAPLKLQQAEGIWARFGRFSPMGATQSTLLNLTNTYCLLCARHHGEDHKQ